jgi:hypothetical protein
MNIDDLLLQFFDIESEWSRLSLTEHHTPNKDNIIRLDTIKQHPSFSNYNWDLFSPRAKLSRQFAHHQLFLFDFYSDERDFPFCLLSIRFKSY